jgi:Pentapeptide repeats (8 copies)
LLQETAQGWVAIVGGLLTAVLGLLKYFNYRSKRDRIAAVGTSFNTTVDGLASDNDISRMVAALLLRRFFDRHTEQGSAGTPYIKEAVGVIAGMLREQQSPRLQKALADGLRYAIDLRDADLQHCNLQNAYLGLKRGDAQSLDLSGADLFEADCTGASLRSVIANETVFYSAVLEGTTLTDAHCQGADFRDARLSGAKFAGASIAGAKFAGASGIPGEVARLLDKDQVGRPGAVVSA